MKAVDELKTNLTIQSFKSRFNRLLKEKNITVSTLQNSLKCRYGEKAPSVQTVYNWQRGNPPKRSANKKMLCEFFNVQESWLFKEGRFRTEEAEEIAKESQNFLNRWWNDSITFFKIFGYELSFKDDFWLLTDNEGNEFKCDDFTEIIQDISEYAKMKIEKPYQTK